MSVMRVDPSQEVTRGVDYSALVLARLCSHM
jgi:hypothetical protein